MPVLDGMCAEKVFLYDQSNTLTIKGIGATKEIRQIEANLAKNSPGFRSTKLLALTGMSSLEDKRRAFLAGVDG
jgi:CheY-like chemotaxis protein